MRRAERLKTCKYCFNEDGLGAIVNSSRGIIAAYKQEKYANFGAEHFGESLQTGGHRYGFRISTAYCRRNHGSEKSNSLCGPSGKADRKMYSIWIRDREMAAQEAKPGQFISVYTKDGAKLLPRPISICETVREPVSLADCIQ